MAKFEIKVYTSFVIIYDIVDIEMKVFYQNKNSEIKTILYPTNVM